MLVTCNGGRQGNRGLSTQSARHRTAPHNRKRPAPSHRGVQAEKPCVEGQGLRNAAEIQWKRSLHSVPPPAQRAIRLCAESGWTTHTELVGGTESNAVPCCSPYRHTMHFRKSFHQEAEQEPEGSSSHRREDRRALICSRLFRESVQSSGNQERPLVSSIQKEHQRTWQRSQLGAIS